MANKKTNDAEVLKYFSNLNKARKDAMMKSYRTGGLTKCQNGCGTTFKSSGPRVVINKRGGDGLNIGGNGKFKKKVGDVVENIGDSFNRLKPKAKAAIIGGTTALAYGVNRAIKRAKAKNG